MCSGNRIIACINDFDAIDAILDTKRNEGPEAADLYCFPRAACGVDGTFRHV